MRGKNRWVAILLGGLMVLPGCGVPQAPVEVTATPTPTVAPTPAPAAENEFALPCYPVGSFHPITGTNRLNLTLAPLMYRGLFALDRNFTVQKDLCEDYTVNEDATVWTFTLAEAAFSNGEPFTSAEAVASLNAARKSDRYGSRLAGITRVKALEERKIEVTLSQSNGALPALLDVPMVQETEDPLRPLGTGPYFLGEKDGGLILVARDGAEVPREIVELHPVGSGDDLIYAFDTGEISLVDTDLTGSNMPGYSGRQETTDYPTTTMLYVGCNTSSGSCKDETVRQAVARAFDREQIVGEILSGHGVAAALPVHPYTEEYDAHVAEELAYDKERALELLAGAGWSPGEEGTLVRRRATLTLKFVVNQENIYKVTVAEALCESLKELGCAVTLVKLPWDDFVTTLEKGQFDLYLGESILTGDFALETLLGEKGGLNYGKYKDKETEALMEERQALTGEERITAASALWSRLAQTAPVVPLCFKNGSLLTQWGRVRGMAPTQRDVFAGLENWSVSG